MDFGIRPMWILVPDQILSIDLFWLVHQRLLLVTNVMNQTQQSKYSFLGNWKKLEVEELIVLLAATINVTWNYSSRNTRVEFTVRQTREYQVSVLTLKIYHQYISNAFTISCQLGLTFLPRPPLKLDYPVALNSMLNFAHYCCAWPLAAAQYPIPTDR